MKSADWWTRNLSPWSGCLDLALPPEQRKIGCRKCWLPSLLSGPRGKTIHGDHPPHEIVLHPERLAQALKLRAPQRFGWINGEVADVARLHPEYLSECVDRMGATAHGVGMPTSDPAGLIEWATARFRRARPAPRNVLPMISASTQQEVDERLPYGRELGRLGWSWGVHAEPMLEPLSIIPDAYGMDMRDAPSWIVVGAAKGHRVTEAERVWYTSLRDQAAYAGVPFWLKTPDALPGETCVGLPAGWPGGEK